MGLAKGLGASCIGQPMAFNQDLKALIPGERVMGQFLVYALTAIEQRVLNNVSEAAHGTKRLSQDDLASAELRLPGLSEQNAIARLLNGIADAIDLEKGKTAALEDIFQALVHQLTTGSLRVSDRDLSSLDAEEEK